MSDVLVSLPGLNPDDAQLQDLLEDLVRDDLDTKEDDKSPKDTQH